MNQRTFLLVRHPEAQKNVENRHGGEGTSLTKRGLQQVGAIAHYILNKFSPLDRCVLIGHHIPQVQETAERLGEMLRLMPMWDERLRGIDLGGLAGLSRAEAAREWPDEAKRLELWRTERLRIDHLNLPGAEPIDEFKRRIEIMLSEWLEASDVNLLIVICTRSVLIMLLNLIQLGDNFGYHLYKPYDFDVGSMTRVNVVGSCPQVVTINHIGHLTNEISG